MCTAVTYKTKDFYFGRTLDYEYSYVDEITITPRKYPFHFKKEESMTEHYAMIGMAYVLEDYPLYYDAINEKGLGMAGLNFVGNACYGDVIPEKYNVTPYEFIPWILGQCATVSEARSLLKKLNLVNIPFCKELPVAQLHWILADAVEAVTIESTSTGLHVYENPVGVMTNNPSFPQQMFHLNNYMNLSVGNPRNTFGDKLPLETYSRGMGALGLPGDLSSQSRFVRASFVKANSKSGDSEEESVNQFFHIMNSIAMPRGCCEVGENTYEITLYTSCCNGTQGIYYYTTYENHQISAVCMRKEPLDTMELIRYPLRRKEDIFFQNS